jgi:hypothetical protein
MDIRRVRAADMTGTEKITQTKALQADANRTIHGHLSGLGVAGRRFLLMFPGSGIARWVPLKSPPPASLPRSLGDPQLVDI